MIQKSAILPIISLVLLGVGNVFHTSIPSGLDAQIADAVIAVVLVVHSIWIGVLKNHKVEKPPIA